MLECIRELFDAWNGSGITYCHWKSSDHIEAALAGDTDLDILVDRAQQEKTETLARSIGFIRLATTPLRAYPGVEDYLCYDKLGNKIVHLHLHYQIVAGDRWVKAYHFPFEHRILGRVVRDELSNSYVINPLDELAIFLMRMAVKFKRPLSSKKVKAELEYLIHRVPEGQDYSHMLNGYPEQLATCLTFLMKNGSCSNQLSDYMRLLRKHLRNYLRYNSLQFKSLSSIRYTFRLYVEYRRRIRHNYSYGRRSIPQAGFVVAFVGIDGSGKTSAIARTEEFFASHMNVAKVFVGSGRSGATWYRKVIFAIFDSVKRAKRSTSGSGSIKSSKPGLKKNVWNIICIKDRMRALRQAFRHKANGTLVLADRWPQTTFAYVNDGPRFIESENMGVVYSYGATLEKCMHGWIEQSVPDLIILFDVSAEMSLKRKPDELEYEQAGEMIDKIKRIVWPPGSRYIVIDSNQPIESVDCEVRGAIWEQMHGICS